MFPTRPNATNKQADKKQTHGDLEDFTAEPRVVWLSAQATALQKTQERVGKALQAQVAH